MAEIRALILIRLRQFGLLSQLLKLGERIFWEVIRTWHVYLLKVHRKKRTTYMDVTQNRQLTK